MSTMSSWCQGQRVRPTERMSVRSEDPPTVTPCGLGPSRRRSRVAVADASGLGVVMSAKLASTGASKSLRTSEFRGCRDRCHSIGCDGWTTIGGPGERVQAVAQRSSTTASSGLSGSLARRGSPDPIGRGARSGSSLGLCRDSRQWSGLEPLVGTRMTDWQCLPSHPKSHPSSPSCRVVSASFLSGRATKCGVLDVKTQVLKGHVAFVERLARHGGGATVRGSTHMAITGGHAGQ